MDVVQPTEWGCFKSPDTPQKEAPATANREGLQVELTSEIQITPESTGVKALAEQYAEAGWALVPIGKGLKKPTTDGWNRRENAVTDPVRAARLRGNVGLLHAYSGTAAIDIDHLERATIWLAERGVKVQELLGALDAVRISSGKPNHAKLLYRLAEPLHSTKIVETIDGVKQNIVDFRCLSRTGNSQQDVLPPSIHPDTGKPYEWVYNDDLVGDWRSLPELPDALRAVWLEELGPEAEPIRERPEPSGDLQRLRRLLKLYSADCDREAWVDALAIIDWESDHSAEGLALAIEWSASGKKFEGDADVESAWGPFKGRACPRPVTISTLEWLVRRDNPKGWAAFENEESADDLPNDYSQRSADQSAPEPQPSATKKATREDFYANLADHDYIHRPTRARWPAASVNNHLQPVGDFSASQWLDRHRFVTQTTWDPGRGEIILDKIVSEGGWIDKPGQRVYNTYRAPTLAPGDPGQAGPWLEHGERLYGAEWFHMICYFAHTLQFPGEKINHALVLGGVPGIGKDTMLEPIKRGVGSWNFTEISPQQLLGRFNGWAKSVVLRVSEARDLGEENRFAFYDHAKSIIAAPPDTLRVDEKNVREYAVLNVLRVILTTNHRTDGIYLPADDRRHYVVWSEIAQKEDLPEGYFARLWDWMNTGGDGHVVAYLRTIDLELIGFDPKAPPPKTDAWHAVVAANSDPAESDLRSALESMGEPEVVTLGDLMQQSDVPFGEDSNLGWLFERKNRRAIPHKMEQAGYVVVRNSDAIDGLWKLDGRRQALYGRKSLTIADRIKAAHDRWQKA